MSKFEVVVDRRGEMIEARSPPVLCARRQGKLEFKVDREESSRGMEFAGVEFEVDRV